MMNNEQNNGRTLDPRAMVIRERNDSEQANSGLPDLVETKNQFREYGDQIRGIVQEETAALTLSAIAFCCALSAISRWDMTVNGKTEFSFPIKSLTICTKVETCTTSITMSNFILNPFFKCCISFYPLLITVNHYLSACEAVNLKL